MIRVRRAWPGDADAVREVGLKTWPVAYAGLASPEFIVDGLAAWWSPEAVDRGIRNGITLIALDDEKVVGMVGLGQEEGFWVMWKLYVHPDHHGHGIGSRLLVEVESRVEGDELWLEVVDGNDRAVAFYRDRGFEEVERTPDDGPDPDDVWMRKRLTR